MERESDRARARGAAVLSQRAGGPSARPARSGRRGHARAGRRDRRRGSAPALPRYHARPALCGAEPDSVRRPVREGRRARLVRTGLDDHRARDRQSGVRRRCGRGPHAARRPAVVHHSEQERNMTTKTRFRDALREQRWDDHRFYHHSRVNQSLHLFSACCFLASYGLLAVDPTQAVWIGWIGAWISRQVGHFFFEPKGYDAVNQMSHQEKEDVKIGYNLTRKVMLFAVFLAAPLALYLDPDLFGLIRPYTEVGTYVGDLSMVWLTVGAGALVLRTVWLFFIRDVQTGIVWFTKILTDPFNDVRTYWKSPYYLLRGELIDPELGQRAHA